MIGGAHKVYMYIIHKRRGSCMWREGAATCGQKGQLRRGSYMRREEAHADRRGSYMWREGVAACGEKG